MVSNSKGFTLCLCHFDDGVNRTLLTTESSLYICLLVDHPPPPPTPPHSLKVYKLGAWRRVESHEVIGHLRMVRSSSLGQLKIHETLIPTPRRPNPFKGTHDLRTFPGSF